MHKASTRYIEIPRTQTKGTTKIQKTRQLHEINESDFPRG